MSALVCLQGADSKEYYLILASDSIESIKIALNSKKMLTVIKVYCTMITDRDYLKLTDYI